MEGYLFCPYCKGDLKESPLLYKCTKCGKNIFKHPYLATGIIPYKNGKVLLCRRKYEPQKGKIDIIGGFVNYGETPEEGALREAKEESGGIHRLVRLIGNYYDTYDYQGITLKTLVYVYLSKFKGTLKPNDDVTSLHWYTLNELPHENELAFNCVKQSLKDLQKSI